MSVKYHMIICFLLVSFNSPVTAQNEQLQGDYDSLFQTSQILINGKLDNTRYPTGIGHPFYGDMSWKEGTIHLDQISIPYSAIRYDLVNDHLQIQHFSSSGSHVIALRKEVAKEFELEEHRFRFLENLKGTENGHESGYYESVYHSEIEIWMKWAKSFVKGSQGSGEYDLSREIYIKKEEKYYRVSNRKTLLDAFPLWENEMKAYLRENHISVRQANIDQLIGMAKFYETL